MYYNETKTHLYIKIFEFFDFISIKLVNFVDGVLGCRLHDNI